MKTLRFLGSVALISLTTVACAQMQHDPPKSVAQSDPHTSFNAMKSLAGDWQGPVTVDPPLPEMQDDKPLHISMRVTSRGNALIHEMQEAGTPLDPTKYDHPVTMFYLDGNQLTLLHYCDAGNRPRMVARSSPDGKKIEFDFVGLSGGNENGHMYHAVFTLVDASHHTEDWTFMMPGDKPLHAHFDLQRTK